MTGYVTAENLPARTKSWLKRIASYKRDANIRPGRSCLLVIDMQRYFVDPAGAAFLPSAQAILGNVENLIDAFRAAECPVVYTRHVHHPQKLDLGVLGEWWDDMIVDGSPDSEICGSIAPRETEKIITKHRYSAFYGTDLEIVLRVLAVQDLAICGVLTNICCESTARDAFSSDFRVFFHADATGTDTEEMHLASLLNLAYGFAYVTTAAETINELRCLRG